MILQKQPDSNCFVYACAMVMGVQAELIFESIGHRGDEVWWPKNEGAKRLRGVHIQEVTKFALDHGYWMIPIDDYPMIAPDDNTEPKSIISNLMYDALHNYDGVFCILLDTGIIHAVAWDRSKELIYDPRGITYTMGLIPGSVFMFVAFGKISR